jgi:hypothetical protein
MSKESNSWRFIGRFPLDFRFGDLNLSQSAISNWQSAIDRPTRYREVVLTSLLPSRATGIGWCLEQNTLPEHYLT